MSGGSQLEMVKESAATQSGPESRMQILESSSGESAVKHRPRIAFEPSPDWYIACRGYCGHGENNY
jgi:hypothetical protein